VSRPRGWLATVFWVIALSGCSQQPVLLRIEGREVPKEIVHYVFEKNRSKAYRATRAISANVNQATFDSALIELSLQQIKKISAVLKLSRSRELVAAEFGLDQLVTGYQQFKNNSSADTGSAQIYFGPRDASFPLYTDIFIDRLQHQLFEYFKREVFDRPAPAIGAESDKGHTDTLVALQFSADSAALLPALMQLHTQLLQTPGITSLARLSDSIVIDTLFFTPRTLRSLSFATQSILLQSNSQKPSPIECHESRCSFYVSLLLMHKSTDSKYSMQVNAYDKAAEKAFSEWITSQQKQLDLRANRAELRALLSTAGAGSKSQTQL